MLCRWLDSGVEIYKHSGMHIITERELIFATVEIRLILKLGYIFEGLLTPSNTSMCFCVHCPHIIHVAIFTCVKKYTVIL
jgi:hypothetical protein